MLVLDSGAVTVLAARTPQAAARLRVLQREGLWPPTVPSLVLVECLHGDAARDAHVNRLLKACDVVDALPEATARRAAQLRRLARRGSAVDAVVVAIAEPGGAAITSDLEDLEALAAYATDVTIHRA
ncbi:MAG: hypothetical protein IT373_36815 [Polyangiaceae bacterium]|nr:hypothetical protein [Polyangiaceae bacterium]